MSRLTLSFWLLVLGLFAVSGCYASAAWRLQSAQQREAKLETGDVVALAGVVDGDTLVVRKEGQGSDTVRLPA